MKKNTYALAAILLLTGTLSSCDRKLSVDPVNNVNADKALLTSSDVEAALVGTYTGLQNPEAYGGYIQMLSDLLADDGEETFVGTFVPPIQINRKAILKDNGFVSSVWVNAYNTINRANNVLANTDKLDTPAKKSRVEGEAKFIRAALYFELVRLYARDWADGTPSANPGVPLVLAPTKVLDATTQVKRNTVDEVYTQIITDLTDAEARIMGMAAVPSFSSNPQSEITAAAAAGMLSRVYLQQGRFPEAAAAANRAITTAYSLTATYAAEFKSGSSNTTEDLFAIQISAQSGSNQLNTFYAAGRRGDVSIEDKHTNQYATTDTRQALFTVSSGQRYSNKYDDLYGNIKVMRLAELLLTRAEANFRAGTVVGAAPLVDVNRVRARVGLAPLVALTLPAILLERKLELAFEGFRFGDLKRSRESVTDPKGAVLAWNSPKLIFPIPLREINVNPNLTQNEGY